MISATVGTEFKPKMSPPNLIVFLIHEAEHCFINDDCTKATELALIALGKRGKRSGARKGKSKQKSNCNTQCENCGKKCHIKVDYWMLGGGKDDQHPKPKNPSKPNKPNDTAKQQQ